jgi:hypothetical protein
VGVRQRSTRDRPEADAASGLMQAGKVWERRTGPTPEMGPSRGRQPRARESGAFTASEESGVYVGRPKN